MVAGPAQGQSVQLFQDSIRWYGNDNGPPVVTPNSQWGSIIAEYQTGMSHNYLNISVNGVWQASNIPLFQFGSAGQLNRVSYHFGLTDTQGAAGPVSFGYSLTETALAVAPSETVMVVPLERIVDIAGGFGSAGASPPTTPPTPPQPAPPTPPGDPPEVTILGPDFVPLDCGENQCAAGAIAANLRYLNERGGQIPDSALGVDFIAEQFGIYDTDEDGVEYYAGFDTSSFEQKAAYYGHYGIQTEIFVSTERAIEIFRRGGVLELVAYGGVDENGDPLDGHVVAVTGLSQSGDMLTLTVADDTDVDAAGGVIDEIIRIDTRRGMVWGPAWVKQRAELGFVGESVVPEPSVWALLVLGFGAAGVLVRLRRGRLRASLNC